jgi:hypothetical protein
MPNNPDPVTLPFVSTQLMGKSGLPSSEFSHISTRAFSNLMLAVAKYWIKEQEEKETAPPDFFVRNGILWSQRES